MFKILFLVLASYGIDYLQAPRYKRVPKRPVSEQRVEILPTGDCEQLPPQKTLGD